MKPKITVVYLLYNAAESVSGLLEVLGRQIHPDLPDPRDQGDWLEVLFMDDCSSDGTVESLQRALEAIGNPSHCRIVPSPENQGLSKSYNKAFGMVQTPYVLTCHLDCFFEGEQYVSKILDLFEKNPDAAAITGQPVVLPEKELPFAEKVNLITNLMDLLPIASEKGLVPVGFAEGRCDGFRISALKEVGFYDTRLRRAGEDQVLAARLREKGYQVYQCSELKYRLTVSDSQDTLSKLVKHQQLFGRAHPYIVMDRSARAGIMGGDAGGNRRARTWLRFQQIVATLVYVWTAVTLLAGGSMVAGLVPLMGVFLWKWFLFRKHLRMIRLNARELLTLFLFQPCLDFGYTLGLVQGLWYMVRRLETID